MKLERSDQDKQWEIPLHVQIDEEDKIKDKMKPESTALQLSPGGTGAEASRQPRFSRKEMQQTTVGGCRHADGSLEQGGAFRFTS